MISHLPCINEFVQDSKRAKKLAEESVQVAFNHSPERQAPEVVKLKKKKSKRNDAESSKRNDVEVSKKENIEPPKASALNVLPKESDAVQPPKHKKSKKS